MKAQWVFVIVIFWLVSAAAAGYGGYQYGFNSGQTRVDDTVRRFMADRAATGASGAATGGGFAAGGQAAGRQQLAAGGFASGQVKQVDGDVIQLSTATEVINVKVSDQTQIEKMGQGSLSDIKAGERVTVQGTRQADGTLAAQSVQVGGRTTGAVQPQGQQARPAAGSGN